MNAAAAPLLELRGVTKRFERKLDFAGRLARRMGANLRETTVHAVDNVSLAVREGEVVGVMAKGYKLGDRLLRPALVKVAKAS